MSEFQITLVIDDRKYSVMLDLVAGEDGQHTEAQIEAIGNMLHDTVRYHFGLILQEEFE